MTKRNQAAAVYGSPEPQKDETMKLAESKWVNSRKNQWREVTVSEDWLRNEIAFLLQQHRYVKSAGDVTRIVLSDHAADGTYKLSYLVSRKEV